MKKPKHPLRIIGSVGASLAVVALACAAFLYGVPLVTHAGSIRANTITARPEMTKLVPAGTNPQSVVINCPAIFGIQCYDPAQIQAAYGFNKLYQLGYTGKGRTIVIIDAFQAPTIQTDLHFFDQVYGLPDPVFTQYTPDGTVPFDYNNQDQAGWDEEITLDVEWSHAIAPDANIDLVLSKTDADTDILSATRFAVDHNLGDVISQSFGENESCADPNLLKAEHQLFQQATQQHITLIASAGDSGAAELTCDGKSYVKAASTPASDPLVLSVGGTQLHADPTTGAYHDEVVWNASVDVVNGAGGGGYSVIYPTPGYQQGVVGNTGRGVPDVSYNASVNDGVVAFLTFPPIGGNNELVTVFGGTSAGSPQWSALTVLADQMAGHRLGFLNAGIYRMNKPGPFYMFAFHDIMSGNNSFNNITGFSATKGWDAASGWGTPKANVLVPLLVSSVFPVDGNGL